MAHPSPLAKVAFGVVTLLIFLALVLTITATGSEAASSSTSPSSSPGADGREGSSSPSPSSSLSLRGVCIFDVDRTLTASQLGHCATAHPVAKTFDNAYGGHYLILEEGGFSRAAIANCFRQGFAVGIATNADSCVQGKLNGEVGKFAWVADMINEGAKNFPHERIRGDKRRRFVGLIGTPASSSLNKEEDAAVTPSHLLPNASNPSTWANGDRPAPFQCGPRSKSQMIKEIHSFWGNIPYEKMIFWDDQPGNLLNVKNDNMTHPTKVQESSVDRGQWTCTELESTCCGVSRSEFDAGIQKVGGSPVGSEGSVSTPSSPPASPTVNGSQSASSLRAASNVSNLSSNLDTSEMNSSPTDFRKAGEGNLRKIYGDNVRAFGESLPKNLIKGEERAT